MNAKHDWVALVLALSIAIAINTITVAVAYDAILRHPPNQITEHTTQLLLAWGGGVIGIIGAIVGYKAGASNGKSDETDE